MTGPWAAPVPRTTRRGSAVGLIIMVAVGAGLVALLGAALLRGLVGGGPAEVVPPPEAGPPSMPATEDPVEPEIPSGDGQRDPRLPDKDWPALPEPTATDAAGLTLQRNDLYTVPIPTQTHCPPPKRVGNMDDLTEVAGQQLECLQDAWRPVLAGLGMDSTEIPVYFYDAQGVDTPCGWVEAPALYCSAQGGSIYFGQSALDGTSWYDLGVKEVAGHEYGHHLQTVAGIRAAAGDLSASEPTRRLELQATCFAYAQIIRDTSVDMTPEQFASIEPALSATIDDGMHGTPEAVAWWGMRGLYGQDLSTCNTWVAAAKDVR